MRSRVIISLRGDSRRDPGHISLGLPPTQPMRILTAVSVIALGASVAGSADGQSSMPNEASLRIGAGVAIPSGMLNASTGVNVSGIATVPLFESSVSVRIQGSYSRFGSGSSTGNPAYFEGSLGLEHDYERRGRTISYSTAGLGY